MAYFVDRNVKLTWWERLYLPEVIRGMYITSRHFFSNLLGFIPFFLGQKKERPIFTVYYPEEMPNIPLAYRGRPVLAVNEHNRLNCVACGLCEAACPAFAIAIESEPRPDGSRRTTKYDIDMTKCIFCGFCQEACTVDAIVEGPNFEYATFWHEELLYDKQKLIANGDKWEPQLARIMEVKTRTR